MDFTVLSDEDVQNYFLHRKGEKTCGRFRNDQLTGKENSLNKLLAASVPFWKKFLAIVVIVFGSLLTGCRENVTGKPMIHDQDIKNESLDMIEAPLAPGKPDITQQNDTMLTEECSSGFMGMVDDIVVGQIVPLESIKGEVVPDFIDDNTIDTAAKVIRDKNGNPKLIGP
ncbi:MAG: hypothetical protein JNK14_12325 [Chitinophagaceae bacterium]|nr:hypothetical protein [Chitinophagaceae bacterium]